MLNLPTEIMVLMQHFTPVFSERTWDWVLVLVVGAILAPGKRTVTAVLRVVGLNDERQFQRYHRVLNRANARATISRKDEDHAAVERVLAEAQRRAPLRRSVNRGTPYGQNGWRDRLIARLSLPHTLRPRGRPRRRTSQRIPPHEEREFAHESQR